MRRVRVVGVGSALGDDAAGVLAVRAARAELERLGVDVREVGAGAHLLDLLEGPDVVIVVDAVWVQGMEPGEIVRVEAGPHGLPAELRTSLSSHGVGVSEAVALASAMPDPPRVILLGVALAEGRGGVRPSARVLGSVPELAARVLAEAAALSRG
ncbi:hypothetical protein HRbin12_00604 [bacterium HR12]|nr:hypothetical protein HRbin12_00604 [bacterium HR12]